MTWIAFIWLIVPACLTLTTVVWREGRFLRASLPLAANDSSLGPWTFRFGLSWLAAAIFSLVTVESRAARSTFPADPDYLIDTWETEDGLPENSATAMVQTSDGYLWFGTFDGLVRFNGVEFTVFNPKNTPHLPSAGIVNLHLDKSERLWVSTYGGLVVGELQPSLRFVAVAGWSGNYVRTFTERANGDLLITSFDGKLFEFSNGKLTELPSPPGAKGEGYLGGVDEDGNWWAVHDSFVVRLKNGSWERVVVPPAVGYGAVCFAPARDGGLWLLLDRELRKLHRGEEVARVTFPEGPFGVWSMTEDQQGIVWIASYNHGFYRVTPEGRMIGLNATNGASDQGRFVFEDRERNIWMGASGDGLLRLKPKRVRHFELLEGRKGLAVRSVAPDAGGGVWAATHGKGLFRLGDFGATDSPLPGLDKNVRYLQSVLADRAGRLWVGTLGESLWVAETNRIQNVPAERIGGENAIALFEDLRGRIWIGGGSNSIAVFDGNDFRRFELVGDSRKLPVTCFAEDAAGVIWAVNDGSVFRWDGEQSVVEVMENGQPIGGISFLKADSDGSMWLGTLDRGLLRWKEGQISAVGAREGFPVGALLAVVEDDRGFFWMTSTRNIVRARRSDLHAAANGIGGRLPWQSFDAADGFAPNAEFSRRQPACARDNAGRLWFATQKGVAMIDPARFGLNTNPPPVKIESLIYHLSSSKTNKPPVRLQAPFSERVTLPAGSRRIEIQYAALSFTAPEKVRFQIKLEDRDEDWHDEGNRRSALFYEVPPGDYTFRVRAANNDGVWNETGASLAFTVRPLFWQTGWFRAGTGVAALAEAGLIAVLVWLNRRRRRAELEVRREQAELRESEARFRTVANNAPVMIWVSGGDKLCTFFNKGWLDFTGRTLEQELGNGWADGVHKDDYAACLDVYTRAFDARQEFTMEYRLRRYDGEYRWVLDQGLPRFATDGAFLGYIGSAIDITALTEAKERFRLVVEAAPNAMIVVNSNGLISMVNGQAEAVFGYARAELIGQPIEMLVPVKLRAQHPAFLRGYFADPKARAMGAGRELFGRRKDGSEVRVEIGLTPLRTVEGLFVLASIVDITERKRAELEIQRQRTELAHMARVTTMGEFAASLAHELNHPQSAILSNAQAGELFLHADPPVLDEVRKIFSDIVRDNRRATEIIQRLRTFLRKREIEVEPVSINALVREIVPLVESDLGVRKVMLRLDLGDGLPSVGADRVHLQQVVLNLILNAMDAMSLVPPDARELRIETRARAAHTIEVAVSDSGTGIPADKLATIFEPFYTSKEHGLGMGLSIARTIVEAHHGRIWAENNPGRGASVRFTLPVAGETSKQ